MGRPNFSACSMMPQRLAVALRPRHAKVAAGHSPPMKLALFDARSTVTGRSSSRAMPPMMAPSSQQARSPRLLKEVGEQAADVVAQVGPVLVPCHAPAIDFCRNYPCSAPLPAVQPQQLDQHGAHLRPWAQRSSKKPHCSSKFRLLKILRQLSPDGLLDHPRAGKADERPGLCQR